MLSNGCFLYRLFRPGDNFALLIAEIGKFAQVAAALVDGRFRQTAQTVAGSAQYLQRSLLRHSRETGGNGSRRGRDRATARLRIRWVAASLRYAPASTMELPTSEAYTRLECLLASGSAVA